MTPTPGTRFVRHRGDTVSFAVSVPAGIHGRGWLRTNLGRAEVGRAEVIDHAERGRAVLARDWHDLAMAEEGEGRFTLTLVLAEVGVFEAKAFFLPDGSAEPVWPEGSNVHLKVEPAHGVAANTIYTAFVRQFRDPEPPSEARDRAVTRLEGDGYAVIPRSGTFRNLIGHLDFILGDLGFRILQLLPIHPTPTTYARMGRFGSPFAVMDFLDVDPALAEFDRRTTPLDQFRELVDEVHARGAKVFLDLPVNHTGWASWLQIHHPEWFVRGHDASFTSPGAWGVVWGDLSQLDYGDRDLWAYMARVFRHWCAFGVDGFRCDAGYMVPREAWRYLVARVRREFPDTVFLLEGLGGPVAVMEDLLGNVGLDWAYSELFQNHHRAQVDAYLPGSLATNDSEGLLVQFSETHDNERLAARSPVWARMRTALCALTASRGGFGITNGVEWLATEKVDVHGASALSWGAEPNLVEVVGRLNRLLSGHPAFFAGASVEPIHRGTGEAVAVRRVARDGLDAVLVVANLTPDRDEIVRWADGGFAAHGPLVDLLNGRSVDPVRDGDGWALSLDPGQVRCLAMRPPRPGPETPRRGEEPARVAHQRLRALVVSLWVSWCPDRPVPEGAVEGWARLLADDPRSACAEISDRPRSPVTRWRWPADRRRTVPVPPDHALWVTAEHPFRVDLKTADSGGRVLHRAFSLPAPGGGGAWTLIPPVPASESARGRVLELTVFGPEIQRGEAPVLQLASGEVPTLSPCRRVGALGPEDHGILTNGRGALSQIRARWGELHSLYDGFLAANLHPAHPVDRHLMLTRLRAWVVVRGYSQPLGPECQRWFGADGRTLAWSFDVPCGLGRHVGLRVQADMPDGRNAVRTLFRREPGGRDPEGLPDDVPVRVIVRPDVEDRTSHAHTKAYEGPEDRWSGCLEVGQGRCVFAPAPDRRLHLSGTPGVFTEEPEWHYAVFRPFEADRGIDPRSDLFSPGYFSADLGPGGALEVVGEVLGGLGDPAPLPQIQEVGAKGDTPLAEVLARALDGFVVARDDARTVIAGYPWFLDWGRDTLIVLRGLVAVGRVRDARDIFLEFARFEQRGTLPNMIRGADVSDRDTSDAPLWFGVAAADLLAAGVDLLEARAGGRTVAEVLLSIGRGYRDGAPNGVGMDPESALVFSPAHFTWMDTNHPAGSPRQGYPVEIQALWWAFLDLLHGLDPEGGWGALGGRVRASLLGLYRVGGRPWLADCLHCVPGTSARVALADDHLRPNQLLAVTLGALDDPEVTRGLVDACTELLVPGAIRTLADRPVSVPLEIVRNGTRLGDPLRPYRGRYEGDEDTRRKPAYHNGTAWTWMFPSYAEALVRAYGEAALQEARAVLGSAVEVLTRGCLGQVPEIVDGDAPHGQRGCGAQAWGASELARVLRRLG